MDGKEIEVVKEYKYLGVFLVDVDPFHILENI